MPTKLKDPIQFWQELNQRRVVRAITVYIASAFAVLEAVDLIFPKIGLPSWAMTIIMIILAVGLIFVIVVTWIYDITPEGIKRTDDKNPQSETNKNVSGYRLSEWDSTATQSPEEILHYPGTVYSDLIVKEKKKGRIYNYSSMVVVMAVMVLFMFSSANTVPFSKRDWVVITDFENQTGEPVFDKSLYTAFTLTANQSSHINILPRSRIIETLARMEKKDLLLIDEATGREIAMREGINIYVVPGISKVGNRYLISARIHDTKTGDLLRTQTLSAENQDEILAKIGQLSKKIRRDFGESRYRIATQDKPLKNVTTSSLEALKLYSLGIDYHLMSNFELARDYYSQALKIDSGFVSAKASLGNILIERFDAEKGRELLSDAVKSVGRLTERERLGILAFYAVNVENDIEKGIEYTKTRINLYPDDAVARNNLGWYYQREGRLEEALKEYKEVVRIDPEMGLTYGGILWIYLEIIGNTDSAMVWAKKMVRDNPENEWSYINLGTAFLCIDSLKSAEKYFRKAMELNPKYILTLYRLAHTLRLQGKHSDAVKILERIPGISSEEVSVYYDIGVNYQAMENKTEAVKYFTIFKENILKVWMKRWPNDPGTYISLGAVTARLGDMKTSREMLEKAVRMDSTRHDRFAELLCLQNRIPEAVTQMDLAFRNGYRNLSWIKMNPDILALHSDPDFIRLLRKYFN